MSNSTRAHYLSRYTARCPTISGGWWKWYACGAQPCRRLFQRGGLCAAIQDRPEYSGRARKAGDNGDQRKEGAAQLSGYKSHRICWLAVVSKSFWESGG